MFSSASSLTNKKPSAGSSDPFLILQCLFFLPAPLCMLMKYMSPLFSNKQENYRTLEGNSCSSILSAADTGRWKINPRFNPQNLKYKLCLTQQRVRAQSGGSVYSSISSGVVAAVCHSAFIPACCSINAIDLAASHNICPMEAGKTGVHRAPEQNSAFIHFRTEWKEMCKHIKMLLWLHRVELGGSGACGPGCRQASVL